MQSAAFFVMATYGLQADEFLETLHQDWWQGFSISEEIYRDHTEVQDLRIFDNAIYGRILTLDGIVQLTEADEFTYHEMLAHVPLFAHGKARKVLIIGGGDGGCLREVLRHKEVEEAVLVDIDRYVIDLSKQYLPNISQGAFDDPRANVVIADGAQFVKETDQKFDVIICDTTDPIGPGEVLFTAEFYGDCANLLNEHGIMVNQHGVPFVQLDEITDAFQRRKDHFKHVTYYTVSVPTYIGGMMTLGWATNSDRYKNLNHKGIQANMKKFKGDLKYYSPEVHEASFALPPYIKAAFQEKKDSS